MSNILEVRGLCKTYGSFRLDNVCFDLPGGGIMGFIGPNGAGKTTVIKLILGAVKAASGSVRLFGLEKGEDAAAQNGRIGVVMDAPLYADDWKAGDLEAAVSPFYQRWDGEQFTRRLRQFGIDKKKKIKELSRGMKIKLQIAAALSHEAKLLILDEPTSGLDPAARDEINDLLREFAGDEDQGVLFSTHISSDLEKTADYITLILNGSIVFSGAKDALLEKYARVSGGPGELSGEQKRLIIGCREYGAGFEGMVETANTGGLPGNVLIEKISLDEIIIFLNKGAQSHG